MELLQCGQPGSNCSSKIFFNQNHSLTVNDSDYDNVGIYTCRAISLAGHVSTSQTNYFPEVLRLPEHSKPSNMVYFDERSNLNLDCTFQVNASI